MTEEAVEYEVATARRHADRTVVDQFGERYGIPTANVLSVLCATAFRLDKDGTAPTNEQCVALMVVCMQYDLNPFTKEIFAFPDKHKGVIPVVSVDGWLRIINSHPQLDGFEFIYSEMMLQDGFTGLKHPAHAWIECAITRKDRAKPIVLREYLDECYRLPSAYGPGPWQTHTNRFLRHKALIQCARYAFGFAGIYDEDEAQRILRDSVDAEGAPATTSTVEMPEEIAQGTGQPDRSGTDQPSTVIKFTDDQAQIKKRAVIVAAGGDLESGPGLPKEREHIDPETGEITTAEDQKSPGPDSGSIEVGDSVSVDREGVITVTPADKTKPVIKFEPITPQRLAMLTKRMEFWGVSEDDLKAKFGVTSDEVTKDRYAEIANWVEER